MTEYIELQLEHGKMTLEMRQSYVPRNNSDANETDYMILVHTHPQRKEKTLYQF